MVILLVLVYPGHPGKRPLNECCNMCIVVTTCQLPYLHFISVQPPCSTRSSSLTLACSLTSSLLQITDRLIVPFNMLHLISGINSQLLCNNLLPIYLSLTVFSLCLSPRPPPLINHFHHPSLPYSFVSSLKHLFHKSFPP